VEKKATKADALRELTTLAQGAHFIPGDSGWPLGQVMPVPKTGAEQESLRLYFRQIREGLVPRLVDRIYNEDGTPNKHWMQYAKKKFMNKEFL
jgi:actin related protein 2/3 complex subunit 3